MIVQFFRYGNGLSKGPLDYLLGKNRDREHAKIMSGDEQEIAELIDSSPFAKKYTSGCLSFYEHDLSDEAKKEIMTNFEQCLFPGMNQNQYRVLWIEHKDKINEETGEQRLELNFLIPNVEIESGQRLQPYYHEADLPRVDLFKKITNFEYQLHDPNDPSFRQAVTTKKNLPKLIKDIKEVIDIEAQKAVEAGLIRDRASMVKWLTDLGLEVDNQKNKSISIKNPHATSENSRNIKLTGTIYEQDFRITAESAELTREASERYRREAQQRNQSDIQRYRAHIERKSAELNDKYRYNANEHRSEAERIYSENSTTNRAEHTENSFSSQQSAREVHSRSTSEISAVKELEYRDSASLDASRFTFEIKYSLDFNSIYSAYFSYFDERNQLREIHGNSREKSAIESNSRCYSSENAGTNKFIRSELQHQKESQVEQIDEYASTIIEDYRRSATAIEETTARTRESIRAYSTTINDYRAVKELHADFTREAQLSSEDRAEISADRAESIRTDYFSKFFEETTRKFGISASRTFERVSDEFEYRFRSEANHSQRATKFSSDRDRSTIEADGRSNHRENDFSRAISTKISAINPTGLFEALNVLDQRRELRLRQAQERKNDRGYDSPSPF